MQLYKGRYTQNCKQSVVSAWLLTWFHRRGNASEVDGVIALAVDIFGL